MNSTNNTEKSNSIGRRARRFGRKVLIIFVLALIAVFLFVYYANYSDGVRAGVVIKVSERGTIFKTREGQLDLLSFGAVESNNQLSQTFNFSVDKGDEELYKQLEDVALTGERVRLRYVEKYASLPWRGETKHFITGVERSGNHTPAKKSSNFPE